MRTLFAIVRKELGGYFRHPLGYLFLVVFLGVSYFFFFRSVLFTNTADMRPLFDLLPWYLLFLVPAATMRLLAEEKKSGTWEVTLTQPIRDWEYLAGKWLAASLFLTVGLLITLSIPASLSLIGNFDAGIVTAQYIGGIFLIFSLASAGIFASSLSKSQIISFLSGIAIIFGFILIGQEIVLVGMPSAVRTLVSRISVAAHYQQFARGVIDLRDVLYFASFIFSFLALAYWRIQAGRLSPKRPLARRLKAGTAIIIVISLLGNMAAQAAIFRIDLSGKKQFTLSPATQRILKELPDIVRITVYQSQDLPPEIIPFSRDARDLVSDFKTNARGNITVAYKDPTKDEETAREAQELGIPSVQFNVLRKNEFEVKQGYFGIVVEYADKKEVIPFVQNTANLEYQLIGFIRKLTRDTLPTVALLSGYGSENSSYSAFRQELSKQYSVQTLTLDEENTEIGGDIATIIVTAISQELPDSVISALVDFIRRGNSVLLLADRALVSAQFLSASSNPSNAHEIASPFGISVEENTAYDLQSNEQVTFGGGFVNYILPYPFWIRSIPNPDHPATQGLETVILPWPSTISVANGENGEEEIIELLQTTQLSGTQSNFPFSVAPDQQFNPDPSSLARLSLAVAVRTAPQGENPPGRIIVVGDSDFLTDEFVRNAPANLAFGVNAVDWLSQEEDLIAIRSKVRAPAPLRAESESEKRVIQLANVYGIPALVAVIGAVVLWRRRKRSRREWEKE